MSWRASAGVTAFALELLPRTTRGQAMDVLSSQANLAGYRAMVDAMAAYARVLPMMMTAAGTVTPAKVFVVGAGVAGLQAIATARRMGAVVSATDVRPAAKEEIESLGGKFEHLKGQDIVVTTAQIPGRKAPRIVTAEMVRSMKAGAVILDMAAESGGNVEGSQPGETVDVNGVAIIGARNLPARLAPATSILYAKNLHNFVQLIVTKEGTLKIDTGDDLVAGTLLTHEGKIVHPNFAS